MNVKYIGNFEMIRIDDKEIPFNLDEVRVFMVGIDSADMIPHLFKHYFDIGVDRIFYIDNNSSDNSLDVLSQYENVHVWLQKELFTKSGSLWIEELLVEYGEGIWCLLVDTDELFVYPGYEMKSIKTFVKEMQQKGGELIGARHIDMYSKKKIKDTVLQNSLLETCGYYDQSEYGCRYRMLGFQARYNKTPLILYNQNMKILPGFHRVMYKIEPRISLVERIYRFIKRKIFRIDIIGVGMKYNIGCALLHFKFMNRLSTLLETHGNKMTDSVTKMPKYLASMEMSFYDEKYSYKYQGTDDLEFFKQFGSWEKNRKALADE